MMFGIMLKWNMSRLSYRSLAQAFDNHIRLIYWTFIFLAPSHWKAISTDFKIPYWSGPNVNYSIFYTTACFC